MDINKLIEERVVFVVYRPGWFGSITHALLEKSPEFVQIDRSGALYCGRPSETVTFEETRGLAHHMISGEWFVPEFHMALSDIKSPRLEDYCTQEFLDLLPNSTGLFVHRIHPRVMRQVLEFIMPKKMIYLSAPSLDEYYPLRLYYDKKIRPNPLAALEEHDIFGETFSRVLGKTVPLTRKRQRIVLKQLIGFDPVKFEDLAKVSSIKNVNIGSIIFDSAEDEYIRMCKFLGITPVWDSISDVIVDYRRSQWTRF